MSHEPGKHRSDRHHDRDLGFFAYHAVGSLATLIPEPARRLLLIPLPFWSRRPNVRASGWGRWLFRLCPNRWHLLTVRRWRFGWFVSRSPDRWRLAIHRGPSICRSLVRL